MAWHHGGNDVKDVVREIGDFAPGYSSKESGYEEQLYDCLHVCFPGEKIYRQYSRGNTTADLYLDFKGDSAKVVVEVKKDLQTRPEFQRLIGQLYSYLTEWRCEVLVILCGENDPLLVNLVREAIAFFETAAGMRARLIEMPVAEQQDVA
jgi:hypothetical protein